MSKKIQNVLIILVFLTGVSVMAYPTVSNWYNQMMGSKIVSNYKETVSNVDEGKYEEMFNSARAFNDTLTGHIQSFESGGEMDVAYRNSLNVLNGMMGYLVIDKIKINLPIYHGTDESVLQKAVGHLEGSDLPTGDTGNSTVLTGHTGLPSADLLTNLTKIEIGDVFEVSVLNEIFTYEVFEINVVEPHEVDDLKAIDDIDMTTLITCTPYGINSHRLLIHGMQIETPEISTEVLPEVGTQQVTEINNTYIVIVIGAVVLLLILKTILSKKKKVAIQTVKEKPVKEKPQKTVKQKTAKQKPQKPVKEKLSKPTKAKKNSTTKAGPSAEEFLDKLDILDSINEVCDGKNNVDE